ncbi:hypothetical protein BU25DRAFT_495177 [Macroventuria anomochaeta]|uniref:Uncharacterized protein n=1 Tax=Macroventuria anomochaeta TaxID=301207 RepID=A0ACB6RK11_9PLEO|nr:uncharacterized protein BU25DRAFT_495177 [Macroventuria anomochaeta]KAF2622241.1 hypothetical protein BU25DRAFT_495177 [Macroventuria anomochaeta]
MGIHPDQPKLTEPEPSRETVTEYVQATSNELLGVDVHIPPSLFEQNGVVVSTKIDGTVMRKVSLRQYEHRREGYTNLIEASALGIDGENMEQPFRFRELNTYESAAIIDDSLPQEVARMGTISVLSYRITNMRMTTMPDREPSLKDIGSLPEKVLKGSSASHTVKYVAHWCLDANLRTGP